LPTFKAARVRFRAPNSPRFSISPASRCPGRPRFWIQVGSRRGRWRRGRGCDAREAVRVNDDHRRNPELRDFSRVGVRLKPVSGGFLSTGWRIWCLAPDNRPNAPNLATPMLTLLYITAVPAGGFYVQCPCFFRSSCTSRCRSPIRKSDPRTMNRRRALSRVLFPMSARRCGVFLTANARPARKSVVQRRGGRPRLTRSIMAGLVRRAFRRARHRRSESPRRVARLLAAYMTVNRERKRAAFQKAASPRAKPPHLSDTCTTCRKVSAVSMPTISKRCRVGENREVPTAAPIRRS